MNRQRKSMLGGDLVRRPSPQKLVRRYLAAFGPATPADLQAWSGSPQLRRTLEGLGKGLRVFRDQGGRALYDLPDAPRPDPDLPAPPRFLPDYDNILLGHADRSRIIADEHHGPRFIGVPTVLVDGFVAGSWKIQRGRGGTAVLQVVPYRRWGKRDATAVLAEGKRLLDFAAADAVRREVRLTVVA